MGKQKNRKQKNQQQKNQIDEKILQSFKKKKRINYITTILIFAVAFFAVWYTNNREYFKDESIRSAVLYAIWGTTIGALVLNYMNWRCPACRKHLGGAMNPQTCKKCGARLQ